MGIFIKTRGSWYLIALSIWFVRYGATKFGGAENYLRRIVTALEDQNSDVGVFSTEPYCHKTVLLPKKKKLPTFLYLKKLAKIIKESRKQYHGTLFALERLPCADIYRAGDGVHKAWLEIKAKHQSKLKTKLEFLNPLHKTYLELEEQTFLNSKLIIANSNRGADEIVYYYGISRDKIRVVYNGVPILKELPSKHLAKKLLEEELGLKKDLPIILFVGSGFFRKGVKDFLKILSFLRMPFNAIVVGKEKKQSDYENLAKALGISDKVKFVGAQTDVKKFYLASDIFLFPTLYEPFSNACLEAMSYANILFTTPQNGVAEILPNDSFIIYDHQNTALSIAALLEDKSSIERIGNEHREIAKNYTVERNIEETLSVINELQ